MPSEKLASAENLLKGNLASAWNILEGSSGDYTDLGIARRFGGSSAAYSLRDIGAMNGRVVKARRDVDGQGSDPEEDFSANQVQSGALEDWVNGKLEDTLPCNVGNDFTSGSFVVSGADITGFNGTYIFNATNGRWESESIAGRYFFLDGSTWKWEVISTTITASTSGEYPWTSDFTDSILIGESVRYSSIDFSTAAAAYSLRKVKDGYSGDAVRIRRSSDDIEVDVAFDSDGKVSASSAITNVAEQGGESGQTTATILGDFISGTDAFVHTWYDQAGVNDAVQETAANQPKIAESGALLDGINFNANTDGTSPDFLQVATKLGVTTDHFVSAVFNGYQTDSSAFGAIINTRNGNAGFQYGIASSDNVQAFFYAGAGNNANSSSNFDLSNNSPKRLVTFDKDGNDLTGFGNATTNGISLSNGINTPSTTVTNIGVGGNVGTTTSLGLRANINELIVYESDQADNRFKIESNINNYYGLYNDANDLTQTEWQNTGAESFSSTSTDGFSYSNSSSTAFIGVTLSETLALNDSVFVSFNASGITHPDSSDQSPQIRLRDSVSGGSGSSIINQVVNGFNSYTLTYNDATKANGQNIVFSEGDTAGGTVTISDFKVSRIARNGFVETLYDQSGNGRDISQASASNQPTIVSNGGIYKSGAYPSIRYTDTSATYLVTESYSPVEQGGSGMPNFTLFAVTGIPESAGFDSIVSAGGSEGSNSIGGFKLRHLKDASGNIDSRIDIAQTGVSPHQANAQSNNATPQSVNLLTSYLDSTDDELFAQQNSATSGTTTTTLIPLSGQGAENDNLKVGTDMFNDSPRASYLGEILEIILYTDSKKSDLSDLTDEINNFYNI